MEDSPYRKYPLKVKWRPEYEPIDTEAQIDVSEPVANLFSYNPPIILQDLPDITQEVRDSLDSIAKYDLSRGGGYDGGLTTLRSRQLIADRILKEITESTDIKSLAQTMKGLFTSEGEKEIILALKQTIDDMETSSKSFKSREAPSAGIASQYRKLEKQLRVMKDDVRKLSDNASIIERLRKDQAILNKGIRKLRADLMKAPVVIDKPDITGDENTLQLINGQIKLLRDSQYLTFPGFMIILPKLIHIVGLSMMAVRLISNIKSVFKVSSAGKNILLSAVGRIDEEDREAARRIFKRKFKVALNERGDSYVFFDKLYDALSSYDDRDVTKSAFERYVWRSSKSLNNILTIPGGEAIATPRHKYIYWVVWSVLVGYLDEISKLTEQFNNSIKKLSTKHVEVSPGRIALPTSLQKYINGLYSYTSKAELLQVLDENRSSEYNEDRLPNGGYAYEGKLYEMDDLYTIIEDDSRSIDSKVLNIPLTIGEHGKKTSQLHKNSSKLLRNMNTANCRKMYKDQGDLVQSIVTGVERMKNDVQGGDINEKSFDTYRGLRNMTDTYLSNYASNSICISPPKMRGLEEIVARSITNARLDYYMDSFVKYKSLDKENKEMVNGLLKGLRKDIGRNKLKYDTLVDQMDGLLSFKSSMETEMVSMKNNISEFKESSIRSQNDSLKTLNKFIRDTVKETPVGEYITEEDFNKRFTNVQDKLKEIDKVIKKNMVVKKKQEADVYESQINANRVKLNQSKVSIDRITKELEAMKKKRDEMASSQSEDFIKLKRSISGKHDELTSMKRKYAKLEKNMADYAARFEKKNGEIRALGKTLSKLKSMSESYTRLENVGQLTDDKIHKLVQILDKQQKMIDTVGDSVINIKKDQLSIENKTRNNITTAKTLSVNRNKQYLDELKSKGGKKIRKIMKIHEEIKAQLQAQGSKADIRSKLNLIKNMGVSNISYDKYEYLVYDIYNGDANLGDMDRVGVPRILNMTVASYQPLQARSVTSGKHKSYNTLSSFMNILGVMGQIVGSSTMLTDIPKGIVTVTKETAKNIADEINTGSDQMSDITSFASISAIEKIINDDEAIKKKVDDLGSKVANREVKGSETEIKNIFNDMAKAIARSRGDDPRVEKKSKPSSTGIFSFWKGLAGSPSEIEEEESASLSPLSDPNVEIRETATTNKQQFEEIAKATEKLEDELKEKSRNILDAIKEINIPRTVAVTS